LKHRLGLVEPVSFPQEISEVIEAFAKRLPIRRCSLFDNCEFTPEKRLGLVEPVSFLQEAWTA
jgi:hypothetical protein